MTGIDAALALLWLWYLMRRWVEAHGRKTPRLVDRTADVLAGAALIYTFWQIGWVYTFVVLVTASFTVYVRAWWRYRKWHKHGDVRLHPDPMDKLAAHALLDYEFDLRGVRQTDPIRARSHRRLDRTYEEMGWED